MSCQTVWKLVPFCYVKAVETIKISSQKNTTAISGYKKMKKRKEEEKEKEEDEEEKEKEEKEEKEEEQEQEKKQKIQEELQMSLYPRG